MSEGKLTVLLAGFGGPESLDQVPAFVESVLGRVPPEHVIPAALNRYRTIGGGSPLPGTTRRQAKLLGEELGRRGIDAEVHVGMLHANPTIEETADRIGDDGADDVYVLSLAPYRCEVSTDAYEAAVSRAFDGHPRGLFFGPDWNDHSGYVAALADMLGDAMARAPRGTEVIFAAHSLPQRMIEQGDPYADQLAETAAAVARKVGLDKWHVAYQSVSAAAREPWLGPSVEEVMEGLADSDVTSVMVDPIGFIADHVETLYDNDVEHRARATSLGLEFHRCACLNEHPGLIGAFADIIEGMSQSR